MQKPKQKDQSGNPLHPGADDPRHAPESGEPREMGQHRGKPIDELTGESQSQRRDKGKQQPRR